MFQMKELKIKTSDSKVFKVARNTLKFFKTIDEMIGCFDSNEVSAGTIPLKQVNSTIFKMLLKWVEHHQNDQQHDSEPTEPAQQLSDFDRNFIIEHDDYLFEIVNAANFFGIEKLSEMLCKHLASNLSNKSSAEIREEYGIEAKKPRSVWKFTACKIKSVELNQAKRILTHKKSLVK